MTLFPLTSNFEEDFVLQLLAVDSEDTMDQVAAAAAHHSVGRRVADRPGRVLRVRRQGDTEPFPRSLTVARSGLTPMACVEVVWERPADRASGR